MIIDQIMQSMEKLNNNDLRTIKNYAEGLINKNMGFGIKSDFPIEGNEYTIGDNSNGHFKIKVIKNRRKKSLVKIIEKISSGTRRKTNDWNTGVEMLVPFSFFKLNE